MLLKNNNINTIIHTIPANTYWPRVSLVPVSTARISIPRGIIHQYWKYEEENEFKIYFKNMYEQIVMTIMWRSGQC